MAEKQTHENNSFFSIEAEQFVTSVEKLQKLKLCGRGWEGRWHTSKKRKNWRRLLLRSLESQDSCFLDVWWVCRRVGRGTISREILEKKLLSQYQKKPCNGAAGEIHEKTNIAGGKTNPRSLAMLDNTLYTPSVGEIDTDTDTSIDNIY